ncbi:MAG: hypothetical protein ABSG43_18735, partial [Solirubrobacteraceae bacterium]
MAVSREAREGIADWLIVIGSVLLAGSLFLTWSHQLSRSVLSAYGHSQLLRGVPADPTAWQVYSVMDVALGLLAVGLFAVALIGARGARVVALAGCSIGFAFTVHALSDPPTNHA